MNKIIIGVAVALIFAVGAFAYAHGPGYGGGGGGHMMGLGYGNHMMGQGYGRHMMDREGAGFEDNQKFLDETKEMRKELHNKRFEYMEMGRNSDTSEETLTKLEKEIYGLEDRIREKAPRNAMGKAGNYGHCW